jgi:hypothetical protein
MKTLASPLRFSSAIWTGISLLIILSIGGACVLSQALPILGQNYADELRRHEAETVVPGSEASAYARNSDDGVQATSLDNDLSEVTPSDDEHSQR